MLTAQWTCQRCHWSGTTEELADKKTNAGNMKVCPICRRRDELE